VGVGIEISEFSGRVIIANVFEQGSAGGAGIIAGDIIVGIDEVDTHEESLAEVVTRIRGEPGTMVNIQVERPITHEQLSFELERKAIALDSVVELEMKTEDVGYFQIRQFIDATDVEMIAAIKALSA
ncbi:MAG: PDZ domain-containing protein, partial [Opitutales bacterium]|nr:PDZ domain-containing protein [Opitutales bacterium]